MRSLHIIAVHTLGFLTPDLLLLVYEINLPHRNYLQKQLEKTELNDHTTASPITQV